jgi:hypothetical protein
VFILPVSDDSFREGLSGISDHVARWSFFYKKFKTPFRPPILKRGVFRYNQRKSMVGTEHGGHSKITEAESVLRKLIGTIRTGGYSGGIITAHFSGMGKTYFWETDALK